jgi:dynein light intermediate chain 2
MASLATASNPSNQTGFTDIFQVAEEEDKKSSDHRNLEKTVFFVGEKSSGKSSLISLLRQVQKEDTPKPTYAMEYSFARRNTNLRKEVVNFYELGGGRLLNNLIGTVLTKENYKQFVYVIVIDVSDPSSIIESINYWISSVKKTVDTFFAEMKNNKEAELFVKNYQSIIDKHEDKLKINMMKIPTIVLAHKYDAYEQLEAENRKWVSRILRYFCHINGCSLFFSSVLNQKLSVQIRTLLNNYFFGTTLPTLMQKDYTKQIFITLGQDTLDSMGIQVAGNLSTADVLKKTAKEMFPPKNNIEKDGTIQLDFSKYPETKIDSTKREKTAERDKLNKLTQSHGEKSADKMSREPSYDQFDQSIGEKTSVKYDKPERNGGGYDKPTKVDRVSAVGATGKIGGVDRLPRMTPNIPNNNDDDGNEEAVTYNKSKIVMDQDQQPTQPRVNPPVVKKFRPTNPRPTNPTD